MTSYTTLKGRVEVWKSNGNIKQQKGHPTWAQKRSVLGVRAKSSQTLYRRPAARPTLLGHLFDVRDE